MKPELKSQDVGRPPAPRPLYTDDQIAEHYEVHRSTVWNWAKTGVIKKVKIGRVARFLLPDDEQ